MSEDSDSDPFDLVPKDESDHTLNFSRPQAAPPSQPPRKSPAQNEFEARMMEALARVTEDDRTQVAKMADPDYGSERVLLIPEQAAVIISEYNSHNRDISYYKVRLLADAMKRNEWKWNHQGIAFYESRELADGQHRCMACIVSGKTIPIQITSNLPKDAIDTVDNQTSRSAGDACKLLGITDPKVKARVMERVQEYENELQNMRGRLTVQQVEKLVVQNDEQLDRALMLARQIKAKVATPVQTETEIAICGLAMMRGGYPPTKIAAFCLNVNMGIGDYPECPTTELARIYERANQAEKRKDRLSMRQRMALFFKGANLFTLGKSVSRLKWDGTREPLPSPSAPQDLLTRAAE